MPRSHSGYCIGLLIRVLRDWQVRFLLEALCFCLIPFIIVVYKLRLIKKEMDIHNYKGRFNRTLKRLEEDKKISQPNKKIILQF